MEPTAGKISQVGLRVGQEDGRYGGFLVTWCDKSPGPQLDVGVPRRLIGPAHPPTHSCSPLSVRAAQVSSLCLQNVLRPPTSSGSAPARSSAGDEPSRALSAPLSAPFVIQPQGAGGGAQGGSLPCRPTAALARRNRLHGVSARTLQGCQAAGSPGAEVTQGSARQPSSLAPTLGELLVFGPHSEMARQGLMRALHAGTIPGSAPGSSLMGMLRLEPGPPWTRSALLQSYSTCPNFRRPAAEPCPGAPWEAGGSGGGTRAGALTCGRSRRWPRAGDTPPGRWGS